MRPNLSPSNQTRKPSRYNRRSTIAAKPPNERIPTNQADSLEQASMRNAGNTQQEKVEAAAEKFHPVELFDADYIPSPESAFDVSGGVADSARGLEDRKA